MHVRVVIVAIAAAALVGSNAFAAEPSSPQPRQPEQTPTHRAEIMLASADQASSNPANPQTQSPRRRARVARVTTCRCGDQEAQPDE